MAKQIIIGAISALFAVLATLALAAGSSVSRAEIERMITESENRTMYSVSELKQDQRVILEAIQKIQVDVATLEERSSR